MEPPLKRLKEEFEDEDDEQRFTFEEPSYGESENFDSDIDIDIVNDFFTPATYDDDLISFSFESSSELEESDFEEEPELNSTDPFKQFPANLLDLILQHLKVNEIKGASCVSRIWYRKTSKSENFLERIVLKLGIDETEVPEESSWIRLFGSLRRYKNLQIAIDNDKTYEKICDAIIKRYARSLVMLKLMKVGGFNTILKKALPFDNLEVLDLYVVCGRIFGGLEDARSLKKLSVCGLNSTALMKCLENNANLEELVLYENSFISYFNADMSKLASFQLKSFSLKDHINTNFTLEGELAATDWEVKDRMNILKFLKSQATSLKFLHFDKCFTSDLNRIIKALPYLKCLEVNSFVGEPNELKLEANLNIESFVSTSICDELIEGITNNFKNMKNLYVKNLKTHQFFAIVNNSPNLTRFGYLWASDSQKKCGNFVDLSKLHQGVFGECENIEIFYARQENFMKLLM